MGGPNEVINEDTMRRAYGTDVRIVNLGDPINRQICVPVAGWVKP